MVLDESYLQIITNYNMTSLLVQLTKKGTSLAVINDRVQFDIFHATCDLSLLGTFRKLVSNELK